MINEFKKELIARYLNANKISKTKFCKLCGISLCTLEKVINNNNYRINALFKVAKLVKVQVNQLFSKN